MTDAPFTETLRSFSKLCGGGNEDIAAAIDAALTEIDRLTAENEQLKAERRRNATTTQRIR